MRRLSALVVVAWVAMAAASDRAGSKAADEGPPTRPAARSYLLLNGVALESVVLAARRMNPEYRTLYDGVVESEFVELAPHLFPYEPDSRFAQVWLAAGRGHGYGLRLVTKAPLAEVVTHLQRSLLVDVVESNGQPKQLYLLFFDPRVMHTLLRALRPEQRAAFFGPVEQWIIESEDDSRSDVVYRLAADGGLLQESVPSPTAAMSADEASREIKRWATPEDDEAFRKHLAQFGQIQAFANAREDATPFSSICPCNAFTLSRSSGLTIDRGQHELFAAHALRWYKRRVLNWLAAMSGKGLAPERLRQLVEAGYLQAESYGITTQGPVGDYLELCVRHGLDFHSKRWAKKILADEGLSAAEKLRRLKAKLD